MSDFIAATVLIWIRLLPLLVVAPIPPFERAPLLVRIVVTLSLAVALVSGLEISFSGSSITLLQFFTEFLIGVTLAFSIHSAHAAMHTMGSLLDFQMGFAAASMFDPATSQMSTPVARLMGIGLIIAFLSSNLHYEILVGFSKVCTVLPPGKSIDWSREWLGNLGALYSLGFIVASPLIITLWLVDLSLAFISRSLPQAPIYFVGLPVKIGIGILLLSWFFNQALEPILQVFSGAINHWGSALKI